MCLQFGFVIFGQKDFGAKAAHKMLAKLRPGNFSVVAEENVGLARNFPVGHRVLLPHAKPLPVELGVPAERQHGAG